jgi:hypothetical protein
MFYWAIYKRQNSDAVQETKLVVSSKTDACEEMELHRNSTHVH